MKLPRMPRRRPKPPQTLGDVWFRNIQADDRRAPAARYATPETHRRPIGTTRPLQPVRQAPN